MLKVKDLNVFYGGIHALKGVGLEVNDGEIVTIIGSNGAGKSSLLNSISGMVKYTGNIELSGKNLPRQPHKVVKSGICQVPEGRVVFANLTVHENLKMGAYLRNDIKGIKDDFDRVYNLFPRLKEREKQIAGTLSGGEQQMLVMGRGLMSSPELIMLDEPSLGLAPMLINTIFDIIKEIKAMGKTILLVEQNARMALSISDRGYVLETGKIVLTGKSKELLSDPKVIDAYFGGLE